MCHSLIFGSQFNDTLFMGVSYPREEQLCNNNYYYNYGTVLGPPTGSSGKSIRRCQGCMGLDLANYAPTVTLCPGNACGFT